MRNMHVWHTKNWPFCISFSRVVTHFLGTFSLMFDHVFYVWGAFFTNQNFVPKTKNTNICCYEPKCN